MLRWLIAFALVIASVASADPGGVRIIVNAKNSTRSIERRTVEEAFLKKRTRWDDDTAIQPVDLSQRSGVRERFSHDMLGRDVAAVRRYWAQLVFSGRGIAPPELANEAEVVKYVAAHAGAIGYVSTTTDVAGVKVIEVN